LELLIKRPQEASNWLECSRAFDGQSLKVLDFLIYPSLVLRQVVGKV
jgi:hypothetical protein